MTVVYEIDIGVAEAAANRSVNVTLGLDVLPSVIVDDEGVTVIVGADDVVVGVVVVGVVVVAPPSAVIWQLSVICCSVAFVGEEKTIWKNSVDSAKVSARIITLNVAELPPLGNTSVPLAER